MRVGLAEVQRLLYRLITSPNGVEEGLSAEHDLPAGGLDGIVVNDARVSAVERVDIYANMYFYRLLDAFKEDFPTSLKILGNANFHNLITGYLVTYPPTQPSISDASRNLAAFAAGSKWIETLPHLADLIRLERTLIEVFLAKDAIPLDIKELQTIPASEWPSLRFALNPAVRLIDCHWRVDQLLHVTEEDHQKAFIPPPCELTTIIVWRDDSVRYRVLERFEQKALGEISGGEALMVACDKLAADCNGLNSEKLTRMLFRWVLDGLLVRIQNGKIS